MNKIKLLISNIHNIIPKHVGALGQISRQLLQQSSPDINALIRDDLSFVMYENREITVHKAKQNIFDAARTFTR